MSEDMMVIRTDATEMNKELVAIMETDINSLKDNLSSLEKAQQETTSRMSSMEAKVVNLEQCCETMNSDVAALSYDSETKTNRLEAVEKQLEMLEMDRLKDSLRLFGIDEHDDNIKTMKTIIHDKFFNKTDPDGKLDIHVVLHARCVGNRHGDNARVIIVKFRGQVHIV